MDSSGLPSRVSRTVVLHVDSAAGISGALVTASLVPFASAWRTGKCGGTAQGQM